VTEALYTSSAPVIEVDGQSKGELARDLLRLEVDDSTQGLKTLTARFLAVGPSPGAGAEAIQYLDGAVLDFGKKLAVSIAHGYAKATGRPMAVILHDIVGLLQGTMGIYYAYIDRAPVVVLGGAGPMAYDRRRPNIDWIHTANIQGNVVRDYTKWDDQPASIASVPESVMRGLRISTAAPQGPVYIALDAALQEDELTEEIPLPNWDRLKAPERIGPDPAALRRLPGLLVASGRPGTGAAKTGLKPATRSA